jgi:hypothetical protein
VNDKKPELDKKLLDWLNAQGYPLEMRVARSFQQQGFSVIQSDYYKDPESGDMREIDVHTILDYHGAEFPVHVGFVIECKLSKDKPWILFTGSTSPPGVVTVEQRPASTLGEKLLSALAHERTVQQLAIFRVHERCAYGMTQAFTTANDVTYSAAVSVAKQQ